MAELLYKSFTIIAQASYSEPTQKWIPTASISWTNDAGIRETKLLRDLLERAPTESSAIDFALAVAKTWVDLRLKDQGVDR